MASTHFDIHLPSHHTLVDVAADDSFSHDCPDEHAARIVDGSLLHGVTAELTVSRHVVVSKLSQFPCFGFRFCRVFICAAIIFA